MKLLPNESKYIQSRRKWKQWLDRSMPAYFYKVTTQDEQDMIIHYLQNIESSGGVKFWYRDVMFGICFHTRDSVVENFKEFRNRNIRSSEIHISSKPVIIGGKPHYIQVHKIVFHKKESGRVAKLDKKKTAAVQNYVAKTYREFPMEKFNQIYKEIDYQYLKISTIERIGRYMNLYAIAKGKDGVYVDIEQVHKDREHDRASTRLMLACANIPKSGFFLDVARIFRRFNYNLERAYVSTVESGIADQLAINTFYLTDIKGNPLTAGQELEKFLEEINLIKWVAVDDIIDRQLVQTGLLTMNQANLIRTIADFVHLILADVDSDKFSQHEVYEAFVRHTEISAELFKYFDILFNPEVKTRQKINTSRDSLLKKISVIDTGIAVNDERRKKVLESAVMFISTVLRTNSYVKRKTALSFRLDPAFMAEMIPDCRKRYPGIPYGIFFVANRDFKGFHIRFDNFARGGLRTIILEDPERVAVTSDQLFRECYNLAFTQQKKNKDIPEGGAKGILLVDIGTKLETGGKTGLSEKYRNKLRESYLYESQRVFIHELFDVLIPEESIVDRYKKQELVFLGPDENMTDPMINWIANTSVERGYFAGNSFMSGKPENGINHKEYGVTSMGANVYVEEALKKIGIDPYRNSFSVKLSGGPDGDVAGNEMKILIKNHQSRVKIAAITDGGGAIYDPDGLNNSIIMELIEKGKTVDYYPQGKLGKGGYLLKIRENKAVGTTALQTAFYRNEGNGVEKTWLSGNETNRIYGNHLNEVYSDVFVPAGGRPRTINRNNVERFIMPDGKPSAKIIVEGANLYIEQEARYELEKRGVVVVKDSSANKCGVICSSFEVLAGLLLSKEEFLSEKSIYVKQVLEILKRYAKKEADLLFSEHTKSGKFLCDLSDEISQSIQYLYNDISKSISSLKVKELLSRFDPLIRDYFPELLYKKYYDRIPERLNAIHIRAIVASKLASDIIYKHGLSWKPSLGDMLDVATKTLYL
jgi:glutamate dehydrogenase